MRKKLEYALMLLIVVGVTYWILSSITFKTDVKENISVQIYENNKYVREEIVHIDGTIHKYLLYDRQYFAGKFNLADITQNPEDVWIKWSRDKDMKMQTIASPSSTNFKFDRWILIDRDMRSFVFTYDDGKTATTSMELFESFKEISKNYH